MHLVKFRRHLLHQVALPRLVLPAEGLQLRGRLPQRLAGELGAVLPRLERLVLAALRGKADL